MEYFIKLIKKKYSKDVTSDKKALQKLRREAERAKRALSNQHQVRAHGFSKTGLGCSKSKCVKATRDASGWHRSVEPCIHIPIFLPLLRPQVRVEIEALVDGIDLSEPLTRARFEELNIDLFRKTMKPVQKVRASATIKPVLIN